MLVMQQRVKKKNKQQGERAFFEGKCYFGKRAPVHTWCSAVELHHTI